MLHHQYSSTQVLLYCHTHTLSLFHLGKSVKSFYHIHHKSSLCGIVGFRWFVFFISPSYFLEPSLEPFFFCLRVTFLIFICVTFFLLMLRSDFLNYKANLIGFALSVSFNSVCLNINFLIFIKLLLSN